MSENTTETTDFLKTGQTCSLTRTVNHAYVLGAQVKIETVDHNDPTMTYLVRLLDGGSVSAKWVGRTALTPGALSEMDPLKRAEQAEQALENFRQEVRQAVIDEARRRDWCEKADEWLEALGLPGRWPADFPRHRHAVVVLKDGRWAVRKDDDDSPWRVYQLDGALGEADWQNDEWVAERFATNVSDGADGEDD